jgi:predicted transposase YbfD/YdcC
MELRVANVYNNLNGINSGWIGLQSIVKVKRTIRFTGGKNKDKVFKEIAYFISSLPSNTKAGTFNQGIRSHWSIENSLHYIKDKTFREDSSRIRTKNAPANLSLIRNIAINIFRENNYSNIAQAIRLISNDISKMFELIEG